MGIICECGCAINFDKIDYLNRLIEELNEPTPESPDPPEPPEELNEMPLLLDEIFEEDVILEMEESIYHQIDEYKIKNIFHLDDELKEKITIQIAENIMESLLLIYEEDETITELIDDNLEEKDIRLFVKERVILYFDHVFPNICPIRQIPRSIKMEDFDKINTDNNVQPDTATATATATALSQKIEHLKNQYQPEQRTPEWYEFRNTIMTASNIYKIFGTQAQYNSFICEKCTPPKIETHYSTEGTLHWGQKYEKLSIQLYESMFGTTVSEFGCIRHPKYSYIGASPDGIVTGKSHYGRMVEVKNIVNRVITGNPIEAYWIQMQIQMEVCDLDICDFVETRFKECETMEQWKSVTGKKKGVAVSNIPLLFSGEHVKPEYNFIIFEESTESTDEFVNKWETGATTEIKWWYLDEFSCVVVPRNTEWFDSVLPKITETWNTILKDRVGGFKDRMPKKKPSKCLIPFNVVDSLPIAENIDMLRSPSFHKQIVVVKME
jgi:putative phage-type endonuclease